MKLTKKQVDYLKLLQRSKADINGWVKCSEILYRKIVKPMKEEIPELIDIFDDTLIVRLTEKGKIVSEYLI